MWSCLLLRFLPVILLLSSAGPEDVRLVKGGSRCAGTVEVNREGQWGTVVNFYWDINDAAVVCRELDCGSAISAPRRAHFGEGSGQELLTEVACNGTESTLSMCQSENADQIRALGFIPAPHIFDAGVICSGRQMIRLMGGADRCSGRVEVKFNQSWATLCDVDFDWQDAQVVL
ncbi:deleted in malignant brain tumors 1 protein-like [Scleropages formosus]|uniref:deleted in malignant brain tumors 1 protein-like n=1 Tax=Scleropages formosus TaxID=113540 RepID=UPI0010FAA6F9|nr:deleted in malignant brain tumors 1 protein-like [Scleropages formosus]